MHKIKPSVEFWPATADYQDQVARAARLCYASEGGKRTAEEFCAMLQKNGHTSMFRHGSIYYVAPRSITASNFPWLWTVLQSTPYVGIRYCKRRKEDGTKEKIYFISTNMQYVMEHPWLNEVLAPYQLSEKEFVARAFAENFLPALSLVRYTVCITTQISTSRELNRTSPNSIAEQSTRYVNFFKKGGGITICLPHWYEKAKWYTRMAANIAWKMGDIVYKFLLHCGLPPQDARTSLPLDTATRVAYTYSVCEWRHILDLRLLGTTGKPHPNARISAQQIHDVLLPAIKAYGGEKAKLI